MKATIEQAALLRVLGRVHRIVERRNTIPILGNILIEVQQDAVLFRATDLNMEISDRVRAEVVQKGAVTVPGHLLHEIVRKMPVGGQISVEFDDAAQVLVVKSGRSRFRLQTLPTADFPDLSFGDVTHSFEMKGADLHRLVKRVEFAISSEETRYYLNGIYLHTKNERNRHTLRAVATDGHRLARCDMDLPEGAMGMAGVIIPSKTVSEVDRLFGAADLEVIIDLSPGKVRFSGGDAVLTSKLIDGTFPDYERVIPLNNERVLKVNRSDFSSAADRVATVSTERGRAVKMSLSDRKVELSVQNPDAGNAVEELDAEYASDRMDIGFNSRYLHDIIAQISGEIVELKLADPGSPTLFAGEDADTLYVLMPMRV